MPFLTLSQLPDADRLEVERILAIPAGSRTATEVAYLNARADYLDNRVIEYDADGRILRASGFLVPVDGQAGFAKGALFIERDALGGAAAIYENRGTTASCDFNLIGGTANSIFTTVGPIGSGAIYETASHAGINDAETLINAAGGGIVLLKNGTYNATDHINHKTNVTLVGEGYGTLINVPSGKSFQIKYAENARIENLRIDGIAQTGASMFAVYLENSRHITFDHIWVTNANCFGMFIISAGTVLPYLTDDILIADSYIHSLGNQDTIGGGPVDTGTSTCSNITVRNCTIVQQVETTTPDVPLTGSYDYCLTFVAVKGVKYIGNTCYGGVAFGFEQDWNRDSHISLNTIYPAVGADQVELVVFSRSDATVFHERLLLSFNTIVDGRIHIRGSATGRTKFVSLVGNSVKSATGSPHRTQHGIIFENCFSCTAIGNTLQGAGANNAFHLINSDRITMQGNPIDNWQFAAHSTTFTSTCTFDHNDLTNISGSPKVSQVLGAHNNMGMNPNMIKDLGNKTGAFTITRVDGNVQRMTLTGNITPTITAGEVEGDMLTLILIQDATGSRTVTWPSNFKKAGGSLTLSTGANVQDTVTMVYSGAFWREVSRALNQS